MILIKNDQNVKNRWQTFFEKLKNWKNDEKWQIYENRIFQTRPHIWSISTFRTKTNSLFSEFQEFSSLFTKMFEVMSDRVSSGTPPGTSGKSTFLEIGLFSGTRFAIFQFPYRKYLPKLSKIEKNERKSIFPRYVGISRRVFSKMVPNRVKSGGQKLCSWSKMTINF